MKRLTLLLPACLAAALAGPVTGQGVVAPAASIAASAPETGRTQRPLSGQALRDSGTFPSDLEPVAPKPQIKVPLGRKPPTSVSAAASTAGPTAAGRPASKIDDSVARCKGSADALAPEACLRALAASDPAAR